MATEFQDLTDIIKALSEIIKHLADKGKNLKGQDKNGVVYEKVDEQHFALSFVTFDDVFASVKFDVQLLLTQHEEYVGNMMQDLREGIDERRRERMERLPYNVRVN